jgi:hypothetical protein
LVHIYISYQNFTLLAGWLNNSLKQGHSEEAYCCSDGDEIPYALWNPKAHCFFHNFAPLNFVLSLYVSMILPKRFATRVIYGVVLSCTQILST